MKAYIIERPSAFICKVAQFLQVEEQEYVFVGASARGELEAFSFSGQKGSNQYRIVSEGFDDLVHFKQNIKMDLSPIESLFLSRASKKETRKYSFDAYVCSGKNVYQLSVLFDLSSPVNATLKLEDKRALFEGESEIDEIISCQLANQYLYVLFKSLKGEFAFGESKLSSAEYGNLAPAASTVKKTVLDDAFDCRKTNSNNKPCYFLLSQVTGKDHPSYATVYYASGDNLLYKLHYAEEPMEYKSKLNCVSGAVVYPDVNYKFNNYQVGGGFPIFNSQTNHGKPCVKLISLSSSTTASSFILDKGSASNIHLKVAKFGPLYYNDEKNKHDIFFGIDVQNKIHIRHQSAAKIEKIADHEMTDACWAPDGSCIFIPTTKSKVLLFKFKSELENTFSIASSPNLTKRIIDNFISKKKALLNKYDFAGNQILLYSNDKDEYSLKHSALMKPTEVKKAKPNVTKDGNGATESNQSLDEPQALEPKQQHMSDSNKLEKQFGKKLINSKTVINKGSNFSLPSIADSQIVTEETFYSQPSESNKLKTNNDEKPLISPNWPKLSFPTSSPSENLEDEQILSFEADSAKTDGKYLSDVPTNSLSDIAKTSKDTPLRDTVNRDSEPASENSKVLIHQNTESPSSKIIFKTTDDPHEGKNTTNKPVKEQKNRTSSISTFNGKEGSIKLCALNNGDNIESLGDIIESKNNLIDQSKAMQALANPEQQTFTAEGTLTQASNSSELESDHRADKRSTSFKIDSSKAQPHTDTNSMELDHVHNSNRTSPDAIKPKVVVSENTFKDKSLSKNGSTNYGLELSAILNPSDDSPPQHIIQNRSSSEAAPQPTNSNSEAIKQTNGSQPQVNDRFQQAIGKTAIPFTQKKSKQSNAESSNTKLGRKKRNGSTSRNGNNKIAKALATETVISKDSGIIDGITTDNAAAFKDSPTTNNVFEDNTTVKNPPVSTELLNTRRLKETEEEHTASKKTNSKKKVKNIASESQPNETNGNDLAANAKASSEPGSPETKLSNSVSTTIKVHAPSYLVPKDLKRKVADIDPLNPDAPIKRPKKDLEHLEFSDRLMLNPIVAFSKVRITIPKTRTSFENIILDQYKVEVVNGNGTEQNPSKISVRSINKTDTINSVSEVLEKPLFENYQFFVKNITLATGTASFFAFCSENGIVMICSPKTGMRLEQPLVLGVPISFLESSGDFLACVTTIGDVYCWNIKEQKLEYPVVSLYPILSPFLRASNDILSRAENITELSVTNSGIVLVTLSNGDAFLYDKMMQSWSLINDSWWAYSSRYWDASNNKAGRISNNNIDKKDRTEGDSVLKMLEYKTNEELKRKGVTKLMQNFAKTMLLKEGFENLEQSVSISHLVNKLFVYMKFEEYDNYKDTMITLCSTLAEFDLIDKLSEVFEFLFGENDSEDKIGYLNKHDLLKIVIAAVYQIGTHECKRLARMYADELNMV